jgi:DNA mismatch repair ATPase MutS
LTRVEWCYHTELYEKDAEISHRLLDIKLADPGAMGMLTAGVFENAFDPYAAKLIALGYKVVKVEQMQANTKSSEKKNRPKDQVHALCGCVSDSTRLLTRTDMCMWVCRR